MSEEQYCYQTLADLRRSYERNAKPYIDRLVAIRAIQPPAPVALTLDQAREFIDITMGTDK